MAKDNNAIHHTGFMIKMPSVTGMAKAKAVKAESCWGDMFFDEAILYF